MTEVPQRPPRMALRIGRFRLPVPRSRAGRIGAGVGLVVLGIIPGPPGPGAIPVGLTLLTMDHAPSRRWRRRVVVRMGRRWQRTSRRFSRRPSE